MGEVDCKLLRGKLVDSKLLRGELVDSKLLGVEVEKLHCKSCGVEMCEEDFKLAVEEVHSKLSGLEEVGCMEWRWRR